MFYGPSFDIYLTFLHCEDSIIVTKLESHSNEQCNFSTSELIWDNVMFVSGSGELSTGAIDAGDKITNCSGIIILEWIPNKIKLIALDFSLQDQYN